MQRVVVMPPMGDAAGELVLTRWFKVPGERVLKGEPLFEVATDKVNVSVESLYSGVLGGPVLSEGQAAGEGEAIAYIDDEAG